MECLRKFVLACHYLCEKIISKNDVFIGYQLLLQCCKMYELLYGKDRVTPNMHLRTHMKQYILDFGPVYCFCLFSFERYNGMLGNLPNNKRNIEPQVMRKFCTENIALNLEKTSTVSRTFFGHIFKIRYDWLTKGHSARNGIKTVR